jgi:Fe-S-cluster containining protein
MEKLQTIARQVQAIGFRCIRCGTCCSPVEEDSNLVMVTPGEIRGIMELSGLSWEEVAEPYPEIINDGRGHRYTIGWCILRKSGHCAFFKDGACKVYEKRPWICRTYPFVIESNGIRSYPCPGIGEEISEEDALIIGKDLIVRREAELDDEVRIRAVMSDRNIPRPDYFVVDCEGTKALRCLPTKQPPP